MGLPDTWLSTQYLSADTKDLEIVVESAGNPSLLSVFPAHVLVLRSQSSMLASMLNTIKAASGQLPRMKVTGGFGPRTVEYFLRFIYLKILPKFLPFQNMFELIQMANRFELTELFDECEKRLRSSLSVDTVCEIYQIASQINSRDLVESCRSFIAANYQIILSNDLHFSLLEEQSLMQVLCKIPKSLAKDHEWNKKTRDGEFQRKALLRWKNWKYCAKGGKCNESLSTGLEMQEVENEPAPYGETRESCNWIPELFMDTSLCDVELVVEGDARFPAHSLVLNKQSGAFLAMWNELRSNTDLNKLTVLQLEMKNLTARIAEYLLRFLYTHEIPSEMSEENLAGLLSAAHRLEIALLEKKCVALIQKKVNLTNCCNFLELAERLDVKSLADYCFKKILDNTQKIFKNQLHFALSKQTLVKVLTGMKANGLVKEWSKWRCCLLGVNPDESALSEMVQSLLAEASASARSRRSEEEQLKRNSVPKMLLFSRSSMSEVSPKEKTEET